MDSIGGRGDQLSSICSSLFCFRHIQLHSCTRSRWTVFRIRIESTGIIIRIGLSIMTVHLDSLMPTKRNSRGKRQEKTRERAAAFFMSREGFRQVVPDVLHLPPASEETGAILCQLPATSDVSRQPYVGDQSSILKTQVVRCRSVAEEDGIPPEDLIFGFDLNEQLLALSINPGRSPLPSTSITPTTVDFALRHRERPEILSTAHSCRLSDVIDFVQQTWRLVERRTGVLEQ